MAVTRIAIELISIRDKIMTIVETGRLILRQFNPADADFILKLVNEPAWLRFIGDRGIHTLDQAREYILAGPMRSYQLHDFGLYLVALKENGIPIGMCGLIKRDALEDVDIGFAFLSEYWGRGYAFEAAAAVMALGKTIFGLQRVVAIVDPQNASSLKLLEKLGFHDQARIRLAQDDIELALYSYDQSLEMGSRSHFPV
jgi:RimJ/RimL family protein N-acetyltransferase